MAGTPQGPSHGVELPNNKVAFVFNRAARRIFEGELLSFTAYYQSAASMVKGTPLPPGVSEKNGG